MYREVSDREAVRQAKTINAMVSSFTSLAHVYEALDGTLELWRYRPYYEMLNARAQEIVDEMI